MLESGLLLSGILR